MARRPIEDVIVLLPGITGSVLRKDGRDIWAMSSSAISDALFSLGRNVADLELADDHADDGVTAPLVMPDLHLIPGLWKIDGYSKVARYIQDQFEVASGENFHPFPYDWRRDNRIAAQRLKEQSDRWLHDWRQDHPAAKLILVGHSMGGLVSRYFLECLEGWRDTRMLITFGTPYRGSLNALNFLVHGMKKTLGPIPLLDLTRLLRSFTSVYQLLPIYPCIDEGEGEMIRVSEAVGIANVDSARAKAADEFHREIERAVTAHLDDEEYLRTRYAIHPIVGTFQRTLLSARRSADTLEFLNEYPGEDSDGDGTVPRVSATPIEFAREEGAMFAADRHASLQNNDSVLVQLAGIMSGRDTSRVRAGSSVGLDIDDAFGSEEPIAFAVCSEDPMAQVTAVITRADTGEEVNRVALGAGVGWRPTEIAPLLPGPYRLTVSGDGAVEPINDAFVVLHDVEKATGTVKWFDEAKGYGFIVPDEGDNYIFVHHSNIAAAGFKTLAEGARVEFEPREGAKGPEATDVAVTEVTPTVRSEDERGITVDREETEANHQAPAEPREAQLELGLEQIALQAQDEPQEPQLEPAIEQRYLLGRFPAQIRLGEVVSLLVRLGTRPSEPLSAALKPVTIAPEGIDVVLNLVDHPGFNPHSSERATLKVFPGRDSEWALFDLEAVEQGVHTVQVAAFLGGTYLGVLNVEASIDATVATGTAVDQSAPVGGRQRDPGEVSLLIHYDRDQGVYRYQLIDWSGDTPDEATSHQLLQTPSEAVEALIAQVNTLARGTSPWDAKTTKDWLKNQGIALWNGFIPEALQKEFWARRDRITRMSIVSSGDPVPWELLHPFGGPDYDAGFLIDQFPVARWLYGTAPPSRLRISKADLVLSGGGSLPSAPTEVHAVAQLLNAESIATQTISDLPTLLKLFADRDFGLLHFSCHNAFVAGAPNASRIMMGSQPFEPVFLEQHLERFRPASPLVFMNACRTDGQAPLYTTLDGWALRFLKAGIGAFVGSLWEVVDRSASTYAQEFYRAALAGDTLGEATRKARAAIREEPGDPTWLAYTLYGDPAATVV